MTRSILKALALGVIFTLLFMLFRDGDDDEQPTEEDSVVDEAELAPANATEIEELANLEPEIGIETPPRIQAIAPSLSFVLDAEQGTRTASESHSHIIEEWKGSFWSSLEGLDESWEGREMLLQLPGESLLVTIGSVQRMGERAQVITGTIKGSEFGEFVISYVNQAIAGSIRMPSTNTVYEIRNAGEGVQYLAKVDADALGECGLCAPESEDTFVSESHQ